MLSSEHASVALSNDSPDIRLTRLTNKLPSNKDFYSFTFRHLQIDELATRIWRSAAPLKCKIFCWLAKRRRIPTNERRFRHMLSDSAACPSCPLDEDVDHLLVTCHRAREVWQFFQFGPLAQDPPTFAGLLSSRCTSYETTTVFTAIA
jgi:hypothetical protein